MKTEATPASRALARTCFSLGGADALGFVVVLHTQAGILNPEPLTGTA